MPTNWITVSPADMASVLALPAIEKASQIGAVDSTNTVANILALVVARVRGVIKNNSRNQLSATASTIPPESKQHVLVLAARQLIGSVPTMAAAIAANEDFPTLYTKAEDWLTWVKDGGRVTVPTDPDADLAGPSCSANYTDLSLDASSG